MSAVRDRMVELATAVVGLGAGRASRDAYLDLIAPGEPAGARQSFANLSSCGLVVRGLWGRLGINDPRLFAPYKFGSVIATIDSMGREADAWRTADVDTLPGEGDVLLLDGDSPRAHVATVVRVLLSESTEDSVATLFTVDGGQRDGTGAETILRRQRTLTLGPSGAFLDARDFGPPAVRRLSAFLDLDALAARFLPDGAS